MRQRPRKLPPFRSTNRRATVLSSLLAVQALCAVFFLADVAGDFRLVGLTAHTGFEALVAVALAIGVFFGSREVQRTLDAARRTERAISAASGAFAEMIETCFQVWRLTPAEADVAFFALKGLETGDIARMRGAAQGTVRAQLARVYAKAGVSNRAQFIALFIEELLNEPIAARAPLVLADA